MTRLTAEAESWVISRAQECWAAGPGHHLESAAAQKNAAKSAWRAEAGKGSCAQCSERVRLDPTPSKQKYIARACPARCDA